MNRKLKLGLGGLGFLGVNGAILPLLENNFGAFNSLKIFSWGGHSRTKREVKGDDYKLKLSPSNRGDSVQIDSPKSDTLSEVKLQSQDLNSSNFYFSQPDKDSNISSTITDIFSEIVKEQKAEELKKSVDVKYNESAQRTFGLNFKNQKTYLENFLKAKQGVSEWTKSKSTEGQLEQRAPDLNQNQRRILQELYKLHSELKQKRSGLSTELNQLNNSQVEEGGEEQRQGARDPILRSLQRILWDKGKTKVVGSGSPYHQTWDYNTWKGWKNNPYKDFYKEETEFIKDFEKLNALRAWLYKGRKSLQFDMSSAPRNWGQNFRSQERAVKGNIDNNFSYRHIEAQVAKKLLSEMGQLD